MIDENGKLFGKINIIDFLIVVVLLALVAGAVYKFGILRFGIASKTDTIVMKFMAEEVPDYAASKVEDKDNLVDDTRYTQLGQVTDHKVGPSLTYAANADGQYKMAPKEKMNSILITGIVKGTMTENGCLVNGVRYGIGHSFVLRSGKTKLFVRVYDIEKKDASQ